MTLREVLANRARRKMRELRESRNSTVHPSRRRRLVETLEERKQNRFIESREAARARNHYILVEDENEDDLVEIEPDTSVTVDVTADDQQVEKDDVVKTLNDLAAQLGYDLVPAAPAEAPVEAPAEPAPAEAPVEAPADVPAEVPVDGEAKECKDGECNKAEVTEADDDEDKPEDGQPEEDKPAEGDEQPADGEGDAAEGSDDEDKPEDGQSEEDMPQDVEEVAELLSSIPNEKWNEIVGKILSGKEE